MVLPFVPVTPSVIKRSAGSPYTVAATAPSTARGSAATSTGAPVGLGPGPTARIGEHGDGARLDRVGGEIGAVQVRAGDGGEEVARPDCSRVERHAGHDGRAAGSGREGQTRPQRPRRAGPGSGALGGRRGGPASARPAADQVRTRLATLVDVDWDIALAQRQLRRWGAGRRHLERLQAVRHDLVEHRPGEDAAVVAVDRVLQADRRPRSRGCRPVRSRRRRR